MNGHLFVAPGDITQLAADAIAFSASTYLGRDGTLYASFHENVPGFAAWYDELRRGHAPLPTAGEAFWMPLFHDRRPHGVVVVASTGGPATVEDKASLAVRAALTTAVARLRADGHANRLLIALPAFRVGAGGDRRRRLESAVVQVTAARDFLADREDIDVVFLAYTPTVYRIFLEARRRVLGPLPEDPLRRPELEDALAAGAGVLFVGAGLSRGAGLPDWSGLIERLAADLGVTPGPRLDYLDLAQWYRETVGPTKLADLLRETFAAPALPTLGHYLLLALPVRHIITTNYDNLLEQALNALKRPPVKVLRQEEVTHTGRDGGVYVVKLHGDTEQAEHIVLSRDDYDEFFQRRPAMALLLEGLLLNQTFFFVGYGLRDPNFRQIYSRIGRMLAGAQRPAFATTFEAGGPAGAHLIRQWRRKELHLLALPGADPIEQEQEFLRFLDRLAERVMTGTPGLFLAPEVDVAPALGPLRQALLEQVGPLLEMASAAALSGEDLRQLASVLEFLAAQGWRPAGRATNQLCRLWEQLAAQAADRVERRRCLIHALGAAEGFLDVRRVQEQLEHER